MNRIYTHLLVFLLTGFGCFAPANAMVVKGSFQGTAYDSRIDATSPWSRDFDGEVVTGTFSFDTSGLYPPEVSEPDFYFGFVQADSLRLTFFAEGRTVRFGGEESGDVVFASSGPDGQAITLAPNFTFFYSFAGLQLTGPLFDGVDPATFRPGPVDLANSFAYFFAGRDFGASVELTEVIFAANQIPEPPSRWLVILGLAGLGAAALAKTQTTRRPRVNLHSDRYRCGRPAQFRL